MRQTLFGGATPAVQKSSPMAQAPAPTIVLPQAVMPPQKKKAAKALTPRLRVTLRVGNEFDWKTYEMIHEADTLSTLMAEQEAVKAARRKYRYVEVISVKSM